jgi:hypothetical protein
MVSRTSTTVAAPPQAKLLPLNSPPRPSRSPPLFYDPGQPAKGVMRILHVLGAYKLLFLMSACYYLTIAAYLLLAYWVLTRQWVCAGCLFGIMVIEANIPMPEYHQNPPGLKNWLLRELAWIFDHRLVVTERLDTERPHLIAQYPHGEWPLILGGYGWMNSVCMPHQVTWCAFLADIRNHIGSLPQCC